MKSHAALAGTARKIVMDPIPFEMRQRTVIATDRYIDIQHPFRMFQSFQPVAKFPEVRLHPVDLLDEAGPGLGLCRVEKRQHLVSRYPGNHFFLSSALQGLVLTSSCCRMNIPGYAASPESARARTLSAVCPNRIFLLSSVIADCPEYGWAFA